MKKILFATLLSFVSMLAFSQDNKPGPNSFGIQYGISYGGSLAQSLIFSGWLSHGIEVRGGLQVSFSHSDSKTGDTTSINIGQGNRISGYNFSETKSGTVTVVPNISVLKHFATKSNIDPFVGGALYTSILVQTIQNQTINETTGDNYYHYTNQLTKNPITTTVGLSLVGGVNYFFAKNFAIGVDAGFGFVTGITNGRKLTTNVTANSGLNNQSTVNQSIASYADSKTLTYNFNMSGNGGLRFTYYIPCGKHKTPASKI